MPGGCYLSGMDDPKPSSPEYQEGEQAANAFSSLVKKAVSTPPAYLKKRDEQWRKERKREKSKG